MGPTDLSDYTIQADVRGLDSAAARWATSASSRSATSWCCSATTSGSSCSRGSRKSQRTVKVDYKWNPNAWYTMKLEVQSMDGGKVRARGKVWPKGETEPAAWTIERIDPIGSLRAPRALRRRAVAGRRRVGAVLRQHQGVQERGEIDSRGFAVRGFAIGESRNRSLSDSLGCNPSSQLLLTTGASEASAGSHGGGAPWARGGGAPRATNRCRHSP